MSRSSKYFRDVPNLLYRMNRQIITGIFQKPPAYDVLRRCPPAAPLLATKHPGKIRFDEDSLYPKLHQRMPEFRDEPSDLMSSRPNLGTQIVRLWQANITGLKLSEDEAFQRACAALKPQIEEYRLQIAFDPDDNSPLSASRLHSLVKARFVQMEKLRREGEKSAERRPQSILEQIDERVRARLAGRRPRDFKEIPSPALNILQRFDQDFKKHSENYKLMTIQSGREAIERLIRCDSSVDFSDRSQVTLAVRQYQHFLSQQPWYKKLRIKRFKSQQIFNSAFEQAEIHPEARFKDFIAYILRLQIRIFEERSLVPLPPYTACVSPQLFKAARAILTCERVEYLTQPTEEFFTPEPVFLPFDPLKVDEGAQAMMEKYGIIEGNYLVRDAAEREPLAHDEINKHKLLMYYIDIALAEAPLQPGESDDLVDQLWLEALPRENELLRSRLPPQSWRKSAAKERLDLAAKKNESLLAAVNAEPVENLTENMRK